MYIFIYIWIYLLMWEWYSAHPQIFFHQVVGCIPVVNLIDNLLCDLRCNYTWPLQQEYVVVQLISLLKKSLIFVFLQKVVHSLVPFMRYFMHGRLETLGELYPLWPHVFIRSSFGVWGRQNLVHFCSAYWIYVWLVARHSNGLVLHIYYSTVVITAH